MAAPAASPSYKRHRFPAEIISHCVWLYFCLPLSYRQVELVMAQRGIDVTYEAIRQWCRKFGQQYANELKRRRPKPGDKWHLDEVFLKINGKTQYLWRAVDQDGNVLDILVQSRRNQKAAEKFFRKLLKEYEYVPRVIITDSCPATGRPRRRCCAVWSTGSTGGSITEPRTRIGRPDSGSGCGSGSRRRGRPSASWRPSSRSVGTSACGGIG